MMVEKKVPAVDGTPTTPVGEVKLTSSVNGVPVKLVVPLVGVRVKKPSVSVPPPEPIPTNPFESVWLNVPLAKLRPVVPRVADAVGVQGELAGTLFRLPKQPPVLPTNAVAFATEVVASAVAPSAIIISLRMTTSD
jgi:hypothetical protein